MSSYDEQMSHVDPNRQPGVDGQTATLEPGGDVSTESFGHWTQSALMAAHHARAFLRRPIAVDGIIGPLTKGAIRKFQGVAPELVPDARLGQSGRMDAETVWTLQQVTHVPNPAGRPARPPAALATREEEPRDDTTTGEPAGSTPTATPASAPEADPSEARAAAPMLAGLLGAGTVAAVGVSVASAAAKTSGEEGGGLARSAPANGPLPPKEVAKAIRGSFGQGKEPFAVETIIALQQKLGVPVTGAIDEATVQGVAERAKAEGHQNVTARDATVNRRLLQQMGLPTATLAKGEYQSARKRHGATPTPAEDEALSRFGGYAGYIAGLGTMTFLGRPVVGHPAFLDRLRLAEHFLQRRFPQHQGSAALGQHLGISTVVGFRQTVKRDQMMHGLGFAIDLNPPNNPWIAGDTGKKDIRGRDGEQLASDARGGQAGGLVNANDITVEISRRACAFMGAGEPVDVDTLKGLGELPTTQIFATLQASNLALRRYRELADVSDEELRMAAEQAVARGDDAAAMGDVSFWMRQIRLDDKLVRAPARRRDQQSRRTNWDSPESTNKGFMDLEGVVVQAMRDVAGLRWGAVDQSDASGDVMHFDAYTRDQLASSLRRKVRAARARRAAREAGGGE